MIITTGLGTLLYRFTKELKELKFFEIITNNEEKTRILIVRKVKAQSNDKVYNKKFWCYITAEGAMSAK